MRPPKLVHSLDPVRFALDRLGIVPDDKQALVLRSETRQDMLNCSRRWGKSTVTAILAVHRALFSPQCLVLVLSPSERQSAEFLRKASSFLRKLGIAVKGDGDNEISLLFPNQSRIVGLPAVGISSDGGRSWKMITGAGMPETAPTDIVLDPRSPRENRTFYVAAYGRGVYKSTDGGASWSLKNNGLPANEPFAWRFPRRQDGALYLLIARRSDDGSIGGPGDGGLYFSADGAETWTRVALPEQVNGPNGLAIDPSNPKRMYLAVWGRRGATARKTGGVFRTDDGGKTWTQSLAQDQHVYDVTIDPKDPKVLYACGFESSAWRSADGGNTWTRIRGYDFKWGHRVIPDPSDRSKIYITTYGGSVWHGPAAGDPRAKE